MNPGSQQLKSGDLLVDTAARLARYAGLPIDLEPKLFDLLAYLLRHQGRAVTKDEMLAAVWAGRVVADSAISQAVTKLRKALAASGYPSDAIKTVHGLGYRWDAESGEKGPDRRSSWPKRVALRWAAVGAIVILGLVVSLMPRSGAISSTLAVAPIAVAAETDLDWAELGLAALMSDSLSTRTDLRVLSASRVRSSLNTLGISADASPKVQLSALNKLLGADQLLLAEVRRAGSRYEVSYRLARVGGSISEGRLASDRIDDLTYQLSAKVAGDLDVAYEAGIPVKKISSDDFVNEAFARGLQALLSGESTEAKSYLESALASDPSMHWARYELANALQNLGELEAARDTYQLVLSSALESADPNLAGVAESGLGVLAWRNGRLDDAEKFFLQARDRFQQAGNQANQASAYGNLGILADNRQDWLAARDLYSRSLALYRSEGERFGESAVYTNLAVLERKQGRLDTALQHQQKAIDIQRFAGLRQMLVFSLTHMGKIQVGRGQPREGEALHQEALALAEQIKDRIGAAEVRSAMAELQIGEGRLTEAEEALSRALATYQDLDNPTGAAKARLLVGMVAQLRGDFAAAWDAADLAEQTFVRLADRQLHIEALLAKAAAKPADAEGLLNKAFELAQASKDSRLLALAEQSRARASTSPADHYKAALDHARRAGDRRTEAMIAMEYAEVLLDLGDSEAAAPLVGIVESWSAEYHGALYLRGRYLQATGDLDNASAYLQRAKSAAREAWQPGQQARLQAAIVAAS